MSLAALIAQATERERPTMPCRAAQAAELLDRSKRYAVRHELQHGQFVRWKAGMGPYTDKANADTVLMYWAWDARLAATACTELRLTGKGLVSALANVDCLVAHTSDDGTVLFAAADSRMLEPLPPDELAALLIGTSQPAASAP